MFFIQKLVNNNLFKNNRIIILWNVLPVSGFQNPNGVFEFPTSQLGLILNVGLVLKSSSKITLGPIIGEAR